MFSATRNRLPAVSFAAVSRIGSRERNEDSTLALEQGGRHCFVVADGLGGHGYGDVASKLLTEAFAREFQTAAGNRELLAQAFDLAQANILAMQRAKGAANQMKTTAAALSFRGGKCAWGHAGDSRIYRFKKGKLVSRTLDHSVPQMLVLAKEIKDNEIAAHPDRARLLRAFGDKWDSPKYEISKETPLRRGTAFLLCTDGIWEYFPEGNPPPPPGSDAGHWLSAMLDGIEEAGRRAGDMDNYSAITVIVE